MRCRPLPLPPHPGRWPLALLLAVLPASPCLAEPTSPQPAGKVRRVDDTFRSGDHPVRVEIFEPVAEGKYPAVVLLHALDGLEGDFGTFYRCAAKTCAARGYVVLLVHYFDRTAARKEDWPALRGQFLRCANGDGATDSDRKDLRDHFNGWADAVREAVRHARGRPEVDGERVGLVGFSLGAFLALTVAAEEDLRIAAVVDFFGGLPEEQRGRLKKLPPALIVHGDQDHTVPVREARFLGDWLAAHQVPGEVKVYEGVDHVFATPRGGLDWDAVRDAQRRTAAFLERYLKDGDVEAKGLATEGR
jgi:carboxymethylenebutenolidase